MSQPSAEPVTPLLALVFVCELAMLAGLAVIGATVGHGRAMAIVLGIAFPVIAAVIWGVFLSPKAAVELPELARLVGRVVLMGGTGVGLLGLGHRLSGGALAVVGVVSLIAAFVVGKGS